MEETQLQIMEEKKPGYKKTKLGWIPTDWEYVKIARKVDYLTGFAFKSKEYSNNGIKLLRGANIKRGNLDWNDSNTTYWKEITPKIKKYELREGDLVIAMDGSLVGRSYGLIKKEHLPALLLQRVARIRSKEINLEYLKAWIGSKHFINYCDSVKTVTAIPHISSKDIKNFKIALPNKKEQDEIAEISSNLDRSIYITGELIKKKMQFKRGLMQQLLTGKKRLPGFSGEWKKHTYRELLKEVKRGFDWSDRQEYDLISVRRRSGGLFHRDSLFGHQIKTKNLRTAKTGDFLISKMQIVHGASGLTTEKYDGMKISGSYIALVSRDKDTLDINFLNWYSKLPEFYHQCYISSYGVHIEKMTFDFKLFLKEKIRIPELEEQKTIINVLHASQKEIELLKKKKERLQTQKKGLMQQLLTGKKRLTKTKKQ